MRTSVAIALLVLALLLSFAVGRRTASFQETTVRVDTLIRVDTVRDTTLKVVNRYVVRKDSILVVIGDTIRDTVYVPIPIERKDYRTESYYAVVEGYRPNLVHIETYNKTVYVDKVMTINNKPRWGLGIQVGMGTNFNRVMPYIGVGVQYNLITW